MPPNTVKVDRSTKWGNPWSTKNVQVLIHDGRGSITGARNATAAECVQSFREYLNESEMIEFRAEIQRDLRGKNLACWCKPGSPCHADVLMEIANQPQGT